MESHPLSLELITFAIYSNEISVRHKMAAAPHNSPVWSGMKDCCLSNHNLLAPVIKSNLSGKFNFLRKEELSLTPLILTSPHTFCQLKTKKYVYLIRLKFYYVDNTVLGKNVGVLTLNPLLF